MPEMYILYTYVPPQACRNTCKQMVTGVRIFLQIVHDSTTEDNGNTETEKGMSNAVYVYLMVPSIT